MYVDMCWLTVKNLLYKHLHITPNQVQTGKSLIRQFYTQHSGITIEEVHSMYIKRVELASNYVQKDPVNRFITMPYIYFNLNNPKGFAGTEKWYWETKDRQEKISKELLLERLIKCI